MAGGGPAGSVAALVLARAGVDVVQLHPRSTAGFAIGEGLPPAARPLFSALGLHAALEATAHRPAFGNRSAWGSAQLAITDFIAHPFGCGWHLDRAAFDADLREAARAAGARMLHGTLRDIAGTPHAWELRVDTHDGILSLPAGMVVDCSGRRCLFARHQGARRTRLDRLVACAAVFEEDPADVDATTLVESVRDGWWYSARLPNAARIVMFFTDSDLLQRSAMREPDVYLQSLAATTHIAPPCAARGYRLRLLPWVAVADTARLDMVHGEGWLAAGDAAVSFDPVSSQGIMTAMGLGQQAAEVVIGADARAYANAIDVLFSAYRQARATAYAQERRWPDAPFWMRRQA